MSVTETVLTFVCIPAAVVAIVYGLVYGGSAARSKRYRPGRPFASEPVWFLASSHAGRSTATGSPAGDANIKSALTGPPSSTALSSAAGSSVESSAGGSSDRVEEWPEITRTGETGGASDSW